MKKTVKERLIGYIIFPIVAVLLVFWNILRWIDKDPKYPPDLKWDMKCLWEDTF